MVRGKTSCLRLLFFFFAGFLWGFMIFLCVFLMFSALFTVLIHSFSLFVLYCFVWYTF